MAIDLALLMQGRLNYALPMPSVDDACWERIVAGFGAHYVTNRTGSSFNFERGEGLFRFEGFDAFSAIDGGSVKRIFVERRDGGGNVFKLVEPGWLQFDLRIRSALAFLFFATLLAGLFIGGDPFLWGWGFVGLSVTQIVAIQHGLKRKLFHLIRRESWN
jgi:hypothetical protein